MPLAILLGAPLLAAMLAGLPRAAGRIAALLSLAPVAAALMLWRGVVRGAPASLVGGFLQADALSTLLALCVSSIAALAAWLGPGLWGREDLHERQVRRFVLFSNLFTFTMLAAVTVNNV